jgi:hypothetical protein
MAPKWQAKDDYFETCNCRTLCPCISLGPPTEGNCTVLEWHIESVASEAHVRVQCHSVVNYCRSRAVA